MSIREFIEARLAEDEPPLRAGLVILGEPVKGARERWHAGSHMLSLDRMGRRRLVRHGPRHSDSIDRIEVVQRVMGFSCGARWFGVKSRGDSIHDPPPDGRHEPESEDRERHQRPEAG